MQGEKLLHYCTEAIEKKMLRGVRAFLLNQYYDTFVYPADLTCKHIQCDLLIKVYTNCTESHERNEEMILYV